MTPDEERDRLARGIPPQWASAWGEDEFGVFACFEVGAIEVRMRWIERGRFVMGSPETEVGYDPFDGPQHQVELTRGFWLADTPCTQELWHAVTGEDPSWFHPTRKPIEESPGRPVENVSWNQVQIFVRQLNDRVDGIEADLPTEAQWEYACRAGTTTATYAGDLTEETQDPVLDGIAWYWPNCDRQTHDVRLKRPNPWGLYDILGNVFEWCADSPRTYEPKDVRDPLGTGGNTRTIRGGSWNVNGLYVRASHRYQFHPDLRHADLGFRLARGEVLRPGRPGRGA